jgi:hypothetical protein
MAKGEKEEIWTSCRNNDPISENEARKIGNIEGSADDPESLKILCLIGTFASITGFVLQFEGFRGISWACSIAQLVATTIMTVVRAVVRRGMLESPSAERMMLDHEMEWLSLKIGFDGTYLSRLSDQNYKETLFTQTPFWKVCNQICIPSGDDINKNWDDSDTTFTRPNGKFKNWPGYPLFTSNSQIGEVEETSLKARSVVNVRRRLQELTGWTTPLSPYASLVAGAIKNVMELAKFVEFEQWRTDTFTWYIDVQIDSNSKPGKLRLECRRYGRLEWETNDGKPTWTVPEKEIEAVLSLWMYHFKDKNQHTWKPLLERPFRRVLGPFTEVLKRHLALWAGEKAAGTLEQFWWGKCDDILSLGYGRYLISSFI